ncbi:MAG: hypothetical protein ACU0GG_17060 [Paracoccaceae bacterium]
MRDLQDHHIKPGWTQRRAPRAMLASGLRIADGGFASPPGDHPDENSRNNPVAVCA